MLADISGVQHFFVIPGYTDMRKSIDGLCAIIQDQMHREPDAVSLYLFCGKRRDRIKAILKEPDGLTLIYKRLSVKGIYRWPKTSSEVRDLTWKEFDWLMEGLEIDQPKAFKV